MNKDLTIMVNYWVGVPSRIPSVYLNHCPAVEQLALSHFGNLSELLLLEAHVYSRRDLRDQVTSTDKYSIEPVEPL
ncbi:MAG: hypothetical protein IPK29_03975 [Betaproteobacteria bacterium]|nr:hypothetical protein [Betaproteobacteria bacterium]